MAKIVLYIATSMDGFIADSDGGVDWLPQPDEFADNGDDFGFDELIDRIGFLFTGSVSYEQTLGFGEWAWPEKKTYVFTTRTDLPLAPNSDLINQSIPDFMADFSAANHTKDIWLFGGSNLVKQFSELNLIDECVITVIPQKLGAGIPLIIDTSQYSSRNERACPGNIVQVTLKK